MKVVDLRSDTVTRPTDAMREAMARAEVGDDVFGDDPTVNALQERIAAMLGKEAARACSTLPLHLVCRRATSRSTSNMVFADVQGERAVGLVDHLKSRGVLVTGLYRLRFVTHLDVDTEGVDRAIAAVREHLSA